MKQLFKCGIFAVLFLGAVCSSVFADPSAKLIARSSTTASSANNLTDGVNYNLPASSMTLSQVNTKRLVTIGTTGEISGDITMSTVTYARINTIQFNDGTVINSSSTLGGTMDVYASTAAYLSNITISAPFAFSSTQTFITSFSTRPVSNVCDKAFTISTATFCIRGGTSAKIRLFIRGQDTSFTTAGTAVFSAAVSATSEARTGGELSNVSVAAGQRLVMVVDEIVGAVTDIICDVKGTR